VSPSGNYCSKCNLHNQWCEHIRPVTVQEKRLYELAKAERELLTAADAVWEMYKFRSSEDASVLCRLRDSVRRYRNVTK
jgi:uncharacterized protein YifE (UPF0438 family)